MDFEAGATFKWCTNPARTTPSPMGCPGGHIRPESADDINFNGSDAHQKGVMKQECDLKEREENILAQPARGMQVQSDTGLLNAITAVGAVLILQGLPYATVHALSAHQAWVQPCTSIFQ